MHWSEWTPLFVVAGFLSFGCLFVAFSDIGDWLDKRRDR